MRKGPHPIVFLVFVVCMGRAQDVLRPGMTAAGKIAAGEVRSYEASVPPDTGVVFVLEQGDTDLALSLTCGGAAPVLVDGFERGRETASVQAGLGGGCQMKVYALKLRNPAEFRVRVEAYPNTDIARRRAAEEDSTKAKRLAAIQSEKTWEEALSLRRRTLETWRQLALVEEEAAACAAAGDLQHKLRRFGEAAESYACALDIYHRSGDRRGEAEALNNVGLGNWERGRLEEAAEDFVRARKIWIELKHAYGEAATLTNEGLLAADSGEFTKALEFHDLARRRFRELEAWSAEGLALNNRGVALEALGDLERARRDFEAAVRDFRKAGNAVAEGRTLTHLGQLALRSGSVTLARRLAGNSMQILANTQSRIGRAEATALLGQTYRRMGQPKNALARYGDALALFREAGQPHGVAVVLLEMAGVLVDGNRMAEAWRAFDEAASVCAQAGFRDLSIEALRGRARTARAQGRTTAARNDFEAAVNTTERLRLQSPPGSLRGSYLGERQSVYLDYIDLLIAEHQRSGHSGDAERAFYIAELSRCRTLLDAMAGYSAVQSLTSTASLRARERVLRAQAVFWENRMENAGEALLPSYRARLEETLNEYGDVRSRILASVLSDDWMRRYQPATLRETQRELADDDVLLLSVVTGRRRSYLWAVTRDKCRIAALPAGASLERSARRLLELSGAIPDGATGERDRLASEMSRTLLGQVEPGMWRPKVVVSASGALQCVPFAMLPDPVTGVPLMRRRQVSTIPSTSTLLAIRRARTLRGEGDRIAVFADAVYSPGDPRLKGLGRPSASPVYRRLPYSARAAEAIRAAAPSQVHLYTGFDASLSSLDKLKGFGHRIIHFAVHGRPDLEHPEMSALVLSQFAPTGEKREGSLRAFEIPRYSLVTSLLVLDACHTAIGRVRPGESMPSIAEAFLSSGAARVVASLWPVDDEATSRLMAQFYRVLLATPAASPAAALRAAQAAMADSQRFADPYYWAGFVLSGDFH